MLPLKNFSEIDQKLYKMKLLEALNPKAPAMKNTHVFLTINPAPKITFPDFKKKLLSFLKKNIFADYCGVIEQRGNSPETLGKGFHSHILFKRRTSQDTPKGLPPTNIKRNLKDIWKNYTDVENDSIFNIQFVPHSWAQDKLEYLLSTKKGKGKKEKQDYDLLFRRENDLPSHYGNPDLLD